MNPPLPTIGEVIGDVDLKRLLRLSDLKDGDVLVISDPGYRISEDVHWRIAQGLRQLSGLSKLGLVVLSDEQDLHHLGASQANGLVEKLVRLMTPEDRQALVKLFCLECGALEDRCTCDTTEE